MLKQTMFTEQANAGNKQWKQDCCYPFVFSLTHLPSFLSGIPICKKFKIALSTKSRGSWEPSPTLTHPPSDIIETLTRPTHPPTLESHANFHLPTVTTYGTLIRPPPKTMKTLSNSQQLWVLLVVSIQHFKMHFLTWWKYFFRTQSTSPHHHEWSNASSWML